MNFQHNELVNDNQNSLLSNANTRSLNITAYYNLINFGFLKFETGLGSYFRKWDWIYATGTITSLSINEITIPPSTYAQLSNYCVGYAVSIGLSFELNKIVSLNLRGVYQNDNNGDNSVTARLGINTKF